MPTTRVVTVFYTYSEQTSHTVENKSIIVFFFFPAEKKLWKIFQFSNFHFRLTFDILVAHELVTIDEKKFTPILRLDTPYHSRYKLQALNETHRINIHERVKRTLVIGCWKFASSYASYYTEYSVNMNNPGTSVHPLHPPPPWSLGTSHFREGTSIFIYWKLFSGELRPSYWISFHEKICEILRVFEKMFGTENIFYSNWGGEGYCTKCFLECHLSEKWCLMFPRIDRGEECAGSRTTFLPSSQHPAILPHDE